MVAEGKGTRARIGMMKAPGRTSLRRTA